MWVLFKLPIVFDDENRANLTTPTGFSIEPSSIPGAGLGAWAKVPVRMFSVIGEYEGDEHTDNEASTNYQWNVRWCGLFHSYLQKDDIDYCHRTICKRHSYNKIHKRILYGEGSYRLFLLPNPYYLSCT